MARVEVRHVRRGLVFVLLAASLGLVCGPVTAVSPPTLVLRGSRSASMIVDFAKPVTFDMRDPSDGYWRGVTATLGGGYVGIAVRRLDGRLVFARIVVRGFESTAYAIPVRKLVELGDLHEDVVVPAGRYRVSLLADAPSELRIRMKGLPTSRLLTPTGPERIQAKRLDLRVGGAAPVGYGKVEDVDVGPSSIAVLAEFREFTSATTYRRADYCFTTQADCELPGSGGRGGAEGTGVVGASQWGYGSAWVRPGRYDVLFRTVASNVPLTWSGFVAILG